MNMPPLERTSLDSALRKLEFDKVVQRISLLTASEPGRQKALGLRPLMDPEAISQRHNLVSEAKQLVIQRGMVPLDGIRPIEPSLKKSLIENHALSPQELLEILSTLSASRQANTLILKNRLQYPLLADLASRLYVDRILEYNLENAIAPGGVVKDSASKELHDIRVEIIQANDLLQKQLLLILKRISSQEYLQEEIVTTRDGRMVIPVKASHKNHVRGFIHSTSASGVTVYVEPEETLDLNNRLRELQIREQREIERILRELTAQVRSVAAQLQDSLDTLATIDLFVAAGKYSIEIRGEQPAVTNESRMRIVQGRHPVLLQRHRWDEVVPLDIEFGEHARTFVISGPNAGGKSVALKTVGLLSLCAQAGLHLPAAADSVVPVFRNYFVDIGDEQSIENDLSTFSSHLHRMREVLEQADDRTLVLVDEIGAGTDPDEGAALAAAVLTELTRRGCMTIATTHHGGLKAFAHETAGVVNASLEFDAQTLRPTYRFHTGIPGSSYALELAERLGLPEPLLRDARNRLGNEKEKLERLLTLLEKLTQERDREVTSLRQERAALENMIRAYEEKLSAAKREAAEVRTRTADEAKSLLRELQKTIERVVKEIRETSASRSAVQKARTELAEARTIVASFIEADGEEKEDVRFRVGDIVTLKGGSETGEVVDLRPGVAVVEWKHGKMRVGIANLRHAVKSVSTQPVGVRSAEAGEVKTDVDLRGMYGDEAVEELARFLDRALLHGLNRVHIIHGKGTGALRKRVAEYLQRLPFVKTFRLGDWNEGGAGVTVVELGD